MLRYFYAYHLVVEILNREYLGELKHTFSKVFMFKIKFNRNKISKNGKCLTIVKLEILFDHKLFYIFTKDLEFSPVINKGNIYLKVRFEGNSKNVELFMDV